MRNRGKRAFGALCVIALVISVAAPGWSQALAEQGYYVDLSLAMIDPPPVYAGEKVTINAYVQSSGPDVAQRPYVLASTPWFFPTRIEGWQEIEPWSYRLALEPIAPYTMRVVPLEISVPADFRGPFAIGMVAGSELLDTYPGNELDVVALVPKVRTLLVYDVATTLVGASVHWHVLVRNFGPSFARNFEYALTGPDAAVTTFDCMPVRNGGCWQGIGGMAPDGQIRYQLAAPLPPDDGTVSVTLEITITEPEDENRRVYSIPMSYERAALLRDDFE